jgi:SpoVK/Ycf46/Vps4 family AAA+-type ATPase
MIHGKKPVMTRAVERAVMNAVVMYQQRKKWKQWGLHLIRKQGACILLEGPPGCGKTTIAEYLALRIRKKGMKQFHSRTSVRMFRGKTLDRFANCSRMRVRMVK